MKTKHIERQSDAIEKVDANPATTERVMGEISITKSQLSITVPPPAIIADYLVYYPDAATTFFRWAEEEATHRRKLDEAMITSQINDSRRGMSYGFVLALVGLVVTAAAAYWEQQWVGGIVGGGTIVSLATSFIRGRTLFAELFDSPTRKR